MKDRILKRSNDRIFGGVCAGIAEFYGWQARGVRLAFVLIAVFGGASLIAYFILYFVMPPAD